MDSLMLMLLLLLGSAVSICSGSRILVLNAFSPRSHANTFIPLLEELLRRNHEITYITMHQPSKDIPGLRTIHLKDAAKYFGTMSHMFSCTTMTLKSLYELPEIYRGIAKASMTDHSFQEFWKNPGRYDVIVANALINEGYLGICGALDAPVVLLSPNSLDINDAWDLNVPNPQSIIPGMITDLSCKMTFTERLKNCFYDILWKVLRRCFVYWSDNEVRKYVPNAVSSRDVVKNASVLLLNSHFSYDCPRPYMPFVIDVGAMHCRPAAELPQDFEDFVQGSGDDGFIVFSLGSVVDAQMLPQQFLNSFVEAFSRIKQRVVWKFGKPISNISSNVLLSQWIPQQDLMGHPKCKLAITHGGLLSLQEILYHGVPLLGVPMGADRDGNINKAIKNGFAQKINHETVTAEELVAKITEMTENKMYKQNLEQISTLMKDRPVPPTKTAAYWVEYVIRHKDVIAAISAVLCVALCLLVLFIKLIVKCFRRRCSKKLKRN